MRVGIDPGNTGALALINGNDVVECWDMPTYTVQTAEGGNRTTIDCGMLYTLLQHIRGRYMAVDIYLERQQHNMGSGRKDSAFTAFSIGQNYGKLIACVEIVFHDDYKTVHPVSWKTKAGLKKQPKEAALGYARRILDTKDYLTRKKDIGRADAMLIAYHGE